MSWVGLRRLARLFGPAVLLALGCAPARITDDGGTGSGSTDDGGTSSGTGSSGGGTGSSGDGTEGTGSEVPPPPCGVVLLADIAHGIGGFAIDGAAEGDHSGGSVSGAGDVNGDGLADVLVGAPWADPSGESSGQTWVVFGKEDTDKVQLADLPWGDGGFAMDGEADGDFSGTSVSGAGDVNGDGLADLVVGASWADSDGLRYAGRTYVVFGRAGTSKVSLADVAAGNGGFAMDGEDDDDFSGTSVSGAGDVNGDGLADLVVGASGAEPNGLASGRTYVVFGKTDTDKVRLADVAVGTGGFAMDGEAELSQSGDTVSGAGDVNGDGLADVVVGAVGADPTGSYSGRTYVVFGRVDTQAISLADVAQGNGGFALDGESEEDLSGSAVSGAGDVNGDGLADVVVGAPTRWPYAPIDDTAGRAYVVFGKMSTDRVSLADVAAGTGGFVMHGEAEDDHAGRSVSGAGDINGDGLADVLVGARRADPDGVNTSGRTYVVFGKADTQAISLADVAQGIGGFAMDGEAEDDQAGRSVSGVGDINGDGRSDVIVGAPGAAPNGPYSGRTYVVFGGDFSCGR